MIATPPLTPETYHTPAQKGNTMRALILTALAAFPASAQQQCGARDALIAHLAERYGETRHAVGLAGETALMELFASDDTGTWTITMMLPDGQMCMMASGSNFESVDEDLPPPGVEG